MAQTPEILARFVTVWPSNRTSNLRVPPHQNGHQVHPQGHTTTAPTLGFLRRRRHLGQVRVKLDIVFGSPALHLGNGPPLASGQHLEGPERIWKAKLAHDATVKRAFMPMAEISGLAR